MKLAASVGVSMVVVWAKEFLVGSKQRVRVGGQLSKEVKVNSGVPRGSVLGPLLCLVYVDDIWGNIEFADDFLNYRKIRNKNNRKFDKGSEKLWGMKGGKWD
jgi:hypothetical protein